MRDLLRLLLHLLLLCLSHDDIHRRPVKVVVIGRDIFHGDNVMINIATTAMMSRM